MNTQIQKLLFEGKSKEACDLIKKALQDGIIDFQGFHVNYAHALLCNGDWMEIQSLLPKDTNSLYTSGWLQSLAMGEPINAKKEPIPWLTYPAIDFLDSIIRTEWLVFEWGSGNSTLWWANKINHIYAVESDTDWYGKVSTNLPRNATIFNKTSEEAYINHIDSFNDDYFDVIVIDGDFRNQCAKACIPKLKSNGIIVFDNTDGVMFNDGVIFLREQGFQRIDFWGLIPSYLYKNCTSIFFKNLEVFNNIGLPSQHISSVGISCFQAGDQRELNLTI